MSWKHHASHLFIAIFAAIFGSLITLHFASKIIENKTSGVVPFTTTGSPAVVYSGKASVVTAVKRLGPAVVNITTVSIAQGNFPDDFDHFFRDFFDEEPFSHPYKYKMEGAGSGVIINKDGLIVTNEHVIHKASTITITLTDNRRFQGKVLGSDHLSDIAVVKAISPPKDLPVAVLGDSNRLQVGEWVVAIGNPYGFHNTVTVGVLSGAGRTITGKEKEYQDLLQTDAAINPGNSGGPLADLTGSVIGINTAIIPYAQGIGFSIPVNLVKRVASELIKTGRMTWPFLGINMESLTPEAAKYFKVPLTSGVLVVKVIPRSPAEKNGIQKGDVITEINGEKVGNPEELAKIVQNHRVGDKVSLSLYRKSQLLEKVVELGERPQ